MEKTKLSYLAGVFDGEGCICISKTIRNKTTKPRIAYTMNVILSSTDLRIMRWLVSNFGGQYYVQKHETYGKSRTEFRWSPKGKKNRIEFLLGVLPYLVMKKDQAILALQFERLEREDPEERERLRVLVSSLNKGTVTINTSDAVYVSTAKIESELIGDYESDPVMTQENESSALFLGAS